MRGHHQEREAYEADSMVEHEHTQRDRSGPRTQRGDERDGEEGECRQPEREDGREDALEHAAEDDGEGQDGPAGQQHRDETG